MLDLSATQACIDQTQGPVGGTAQVCPALTHAAIYSLGDAIGAVVHVHSPELWRQHKGRLPTTSPDVGYGTPDMAHEFDRLYRLGGLKEAGVAVMAGHEDGLVSFGTTLEEAATRMLDLLHD